eukprot:612257-Rhodomonas_salina.1
MRCREDVLNPGREGEERTKESSYVGEVVYIDAKWQNQRARAGKVGERITLCNGVLGRMGMDSCEMGVFCSSFISCGTAVEILLVGVALARRRCYFAVCGGLEEQ